MVYEFTVEHMCCRHCESTITDTLEELDEVTDVSADSDTNTVRIAGERETEAQIKDAIEDTGFTVTA